MKRLIKTVKIFNTLFLAAALMMSCITGHGQTVPPGTEINELIKISELYTNADNISFKLKATYADSANQNDLLDSSFYNYKLSKGKYLVTDSSSEIMVNSNYGVFVNLEDSIMMISKRYREASVMQLPILDSLFEENNVSGMNTQDINDSTRYLNILFLPESIYKSYRLNYNPQTGLMRSVIFDIKNVNSYYDLPDSITLRLVYTFTDYSATPLDPALFNEYRYFYMVNGAMFVQPQWEGYQLISQ